PPPSRAGPMRSPAWLTFAAATSLALGACDKSVVIPTLPPRATPSTPEPPGVFTTLQVTTGAALLHAGEDPGRRTVLLVRPLDQRGRYIPASEPPHFWVSDPAVSVSDSGEVVALAVGVAIVHASARVGTVTREGSIEIRVDAGSALRGAGPLMVGG